MTELIEQKQSNDCGIAALAMLSGKPYTTVRRAVLSFNKGKFIGTDGVTAQKAMSSLGQGLRLRAVSAQNLESTRLYLKGRPAVLIVPENVHPASGEFHAVYWTGREVLDPSPNSKYGRKGLKALKVLVEYWELKTN